MAFTDSEIKELLDAFLDLNTERQYIGARYVPIFGRKDEDSIEWDNTKPYEPLTIVLYQGNSFTSRQYVPVGVDIANQEFWAETGNYNAQVEAYRREVLSVSEQLDDIQTEVDVISEGTEYIHVLNAGIDTDISLTTPFYLVKIPISITPKIYMRNNAQQNRFVIPNDINGIFINGALPGPQISGGEIVSNSASTSWWYFTGIKNGAPATEPFPGTNKPTASELLQAGWTFGICTYECILKNFISQNYDDFEGMEHYDTLNLHGPRSAIGWDDASWYIFACDGRQLISHGITHDELVGIGQKYQIPNLVNMDGGASVQLYTSQPVNVWTLTSDSKPTANDLIYNYRRKVVSLIAFEFDGEQE